MESSSGERRESGEERTQECDSQRGSSQCECVERERVCERRSGLGFCRCRVGWSMFYN
jgi:hypothetical protein